MFDHCVSVLRHCAVPASQYPCVKCNSTSKFSKAHSPLVVFVIGMTVNWVGISWCRGESLSPLPLQAIEALEGEVEELQSQKQRIKTEFDQKVCSMCEVQ